MKERWEITTSLVLVNLAVTGKMFYYTSLFLAGGQLSSGVFLSVPMLKITCGWEKIEKVVVVF